METLIPEIWWLAAATFVVAVAYSSVGLGGGTSYTALMTIAGISTLAIPMVSLTLNTLVTSIGSINFWRHGYGRPRLLFPFLLTSFPFAYLGGATILSEWLFNWVLLLCLLAIAARIYCWGSVSLNFQLTRRQQFGVALVSGALLGFISGSIGIGGGVFLIPLIMMLGLGNAKEAAACGVLFTWLNSVSGLISRMQLNSVDLSAFWPLIIAAVSGGVIGSFLGTERFTSQQMERVLGAIVLVAITILLQRMFFSLS